MVVNAVCDPDGLDEQLNLERSKISYSSGGLGNPAQWVFNTSAKYVCPRAFVNPITPTPSPRPAPPSPAPSTNPQIINGWYNLDLRILAQSNATLPIGYGSNYYSGLIFYSI
jgi:hypothetical protein